MDLAFPEKYYEVSKYFDLYIGDLERTPVLTNEQRLLFYALRQQAEHGPCTTPQPSMWYTRERHKHQAWQQLGRMSTFEAMVFFVQQFERVLWTLEHPDDDDAAVAEALKKAKVDWPARLRELKVEGTATVAPAPTNSGPQNTENQPKGDEFTSVAGNLSPPPNTMHTAPLSSPPAEIAKPQPGPSVSPFPPAVASIPAGEMEGWDSDIVAHATLSLDNLRYLAVQLMQARQALRAAREPVPNGERHSTAPHAEELPMPMPPLKPAWTNHGTAMRVPIIPPPVRFSARSLTEAAVRAPRDTIIVNDVCEGNDPAHSNAGTLWFGW